MTVLPHKVVLSREERERIKREAAELTQGSPWQEFVPDVPEFPLSGWGTLAFARLCLSVLAALEQAEQEREDFFTKQGAALSEAAKLRRALTDAADRLAKVPALVEALQHIVDAEAGQLADVASDALAAWEAK